MTAPLPYKLEPKDVAAARKLRASLIEQGVDQGNANAAASVRSGKARRDSLVKDKPVIHGVQGEHPRTQISR